MVRNKATGKKPMTKPATKTKAPPRKPPRKPPAPPAAASPPPPPSRRQIRTKLNETRQRLQLLRDQRQLRFMEQQEKRAKLMESWPFDWVSPYLELVTRYGREWAPLGVPGKDARRHGRMFPLHRTEEELRLIREPARVLFSTVPYAIGLLEGLTSYVVGTGYTYTATVKNAENYPGLVEAAQDVIDKFLLRNQWGGNDSGEVRLCNASMDTCEQPSMEEEAFKRLVIDGEVILAVFYNDDGTADIRVVEPDQLTMPPPGIEFEIDGVKYTTTSDFDEWGYGIFTDPDDAQKPLAYYVQWGATKNDGDVYGPDRIVHLRSNAPRTVKRGHSDAAFDVLDAFQQANLLRGNLGEGAAQQAAIVGVRQHQQGTGDEIQSYNDSLADEERTDAVSGNTDRVTRMKRGIWEDIGAGMDYVNGPGANNASAHALVLQALLRAVSVRWCGTEWLASGDSSNNNYASSLVANSQFVVAIKRRQKTLRGAFGMLVARALLHYVRTKNGLTVTVMENGKRVTKVYSVEAVEMLVSIAVTVPSPESSDPLQQAQRMAVEKQNGVLSVPTWQVKVGYDPDTEQKNIDKWNELNPNMGGTPLGLPGDLPGGSNGQAQ